jgi:hypothetical protein
VDAVVGTDAVFGAGTMELAGDPNSVPAGLVGRVECCGALVPSLTADRWSGGSVFRRFDRLAARGGRRIRHRGLVAVAGGGK